MNYAVGFLYVKNSVLLVRRCNASYGNRLYSLVGGKIEQGESGIQSMAGKLILKSSFFVVKYPFFERYLLHYFNSGKVIDYHVS
ncbi:MAG: hypothetical protein K2X90_00835 [Candidatus Babeliaceae bacterium]|nr:hypothetical protein [Candidatus Babeliaceae bacterium]